MEPTHAHKHHLEVAADRAITEALGGCEKHGPFNSWHEAYAVLKEEVDELWDEIKARNPDRISIAREAKHIAGIALRISAWASRGHAAQPEDGHAAQPEDEDAEWQSRIPATP